MAGQLSSAMSIAGAGLLPNPPGDIGLAITANSNLDNAYSTYNSFNFISNAHTLYDTAQIETISGNISSTTFDEILAIGTGVFPSMVDLPSTGNAIADLIVYGTPANVTANIFTVSNTIDFNKDVLIGNGDPSIFCQIFMAADGYVAQANAVLNSVKNSDILAQTFNPSTGGMTSLTTGGLNQVSNNLQLLSADLSKLGELFSLSTLDNLGLPGELLSQIGKQTGGGLPIINELLLGARLSTTKVNLLGQGTNTLTAQEEKIAYTVLTAITGNSLSQVLAILKVTLTNLVNLAQALDPKKILPTSYKTLLCPTTTGLVNVYLSNGAINTNLESVLNNVGVTLYTGPDNTNSLTALKLIIPPDQAIGNKALSRSLQQLKSISNSSLPKLASAMALVEINTGLTQVANLTTPVPQSVQTFYQQQLGEGTGPNGTLTLYDIIGVPTGNIIVPELQTVSNTINTVSVSGTYSSLNECYINMIDTLGNVFGGPIGNVVIPSGPGAGTYASWDDAFQTGLVPAANVLINTLASSYSVAVGNANSAWGNIISTLIMQHNNQAQAEFDVANLTPNSSTSTMAFTNNLHSYGLEVDPGDANDYLNAVADYNTLSGQCIVTSLREGRNIEALQNAGIRLDTQLNDR